MGDRNDEVGICWLLQRRVTAEISFFQESILYCLTEASLAALKARCPTARVTGAGVGVDSVWEQEKLEARKMPENAAESPASSARFVGLLFALRLISL
jgi:hypothetical protein